MNNKKQITLLLLLCVSLGLSSCGKQSRDYDRQSSSNSERTKEAVAAADSGDSIQSNTLSNKTHVTALGLERTFIKTATTNFHVKDVYKTAMTLENIAVSYGGFVTHNEIINHKQQSTFTKTDNGIQTIVEEYQPVGTLTLRIPHLKIQKFLREMVKHTEFMYARRFDAEDVVLQMLQEQQLAKINKDASTEVSAHINPDNKEKITDTVKAINSMVSYKRDNLIAEIKQADLKDKVAFSTISIQLSQPSVIRTYTKNYFPYYVEQSQPSLIYRLEESLEAGWEHFQNFIVGLISVTPFAIFFGVLLLLFIKIRRWLRKRKDNKEK